MKDKTARRDTLAKKLMAIEQGPTAAELAQSPEAGFLNLPAMLAAWQRRKVERDRILAPAPTDAIEARLRDAERGAKLPQTVISRLRTALRKIATLRRHYPELDIGEGPVLAAAEDLLLRLEYRNTWAEIAAGHRITEVTKDLTADEVRVLGRYLAARDLKREMARGTYGTPEQTLEAAEWANFGFESELQVAEFLASTEQVIAAHPALQAAIATREQFITAFVDALVARDLLPAATAEDPATYYHRQVLAHVRAEEDDRPGGGRDVRMRTKGFQRKRTGGGDFNLRYTEAELEWLSQAYSQIALHDGLAELKKLADQYDTLKAQAAAQNRARFETSLVDELGHIPQGVEHPLTRYSQRIARATARIYALLDEMQLEPPPSFASLLESFRAARDAAGDAKGFRFAHPDWWRFLAWLADQGEADGAIEAATIFKAIQEREAAIAERLGSAYVDPSDAEALLRMAPPKYALWQPIRGNYFYSGLSLTERTLHELLEGTKEVVPEEIRRVLILGGARETWIVPQGLAKTMDRFGQERPINRAERAWLRVFSGVKAWLLLAPERIFRYLLNNSSGDFDAALLYPALLKGVPTAARDLKAWMVTKGASADLLAELEQYARYRVVDHGLTALEVEDLSKLPAFEQIATKDPIGFMRLVSNYVHNARLVTQLRENILRLAAMRYFLPITQREGAVAHTFAASNPVKVRALKDPFARAALLANDLIGDYGATSQFTQFARSRLLPFFSFQELNARRYYYAFKNAALEDESRFERAGKVGAAIGARIGLAAVGTGLKWGFRLGLMTLAVNAFYLTTQLWNRVFFPDEDDELRDRGRGLYVIFGRTPDGRILTLRIEGAWAAFLKWVGLEDYPKEVRGIRQGTRSAKDAFFESLRAPLNQLVNQLEPLSKTLYETLTRRGTFPEATRPRPIRDRLEPLARLASLTWLYRQLTDKPQPPRGLLEDLVLDGNDPGEAAYFHIRAQAARFLRDHKAPAADITPTDRANALYYWRKSLQWGEPERAERWLTRYRELGGTLKDARQSLIESHPLRVVPARYMRAFLQSLTPEEREVLKQAEVWWRQSVETARQRPKAGAR